MGSLKWMAFEFAIFTHNSLEIHSRLHMLVPFNLNIQRKTWLFFSSRAIHGFAHARQVTRQDAQGVGERRSRLLEGGCSCEGVVFYGDCWWTHEPAHFRNPWELSTASHGSNNCLSCELWTEWALGSSFFWLRHWLHFGETMGERSKGCLGFLCLVPVIIPQIKKKKNL